MYSGWSEPRLPVGKEALSSREDPMPNDKGVVGAETIEGCVGAAQDVD